MEEFTFFSLLPHELVEPIDGDVPVLLHEDVGEAQGPVHPPSGMQELQHKDELRNIERTQLFLDQSHTIYNLFQFPPEHKRPQEVQVLVGSINEVRVSDKLVLDFQVSLHLFKLQVLGLKGEILSVLHNFFEEGEHKLVNPDFLSFLVVEELELGILGLIIRQVLEIGVAGVAFGHPVRFISRIAL
jgi:hypothetical protein